MSGVILGSAMVTIGEYAGGGMSPNQLAAIAANKIVSVSDAAHPAIRAQAHAFRRRIESVLVSYFEEMAASERQRLALVLRESGYEDLAEKIQVL